MLKGIYNELSYVVAVFLAIFINRWIVIELVLNCLIHITSFSLLGFNWNGCFPKFCDYIYLLNNLKYFN